MKNFTLAVALLLLTAAGQPSLAQEPAPAEPVVPAVPAAAAPAATAAVQDPDDAVTCEKETVTGSRVKKRLVCSTERQRRAEREQTGDALGNVRTQGGAQTSNGS